MNLRTFKAYSMADCLSLVKGEMGPTAMILHTRTYYQRYWFGLRRREIVEITAGRGEPRRRPGHQTAEAAPVRRQITSYQSNSTATTSAPAPPPGRQLVEP